MKLTSVYVHSLSYFLRQNQTLIMGYHSFARILFDKNRLQHYYKCFMD